MLLCFEIHILTFASFRWLWNARNSIRDVPLENDKTIYPFGSRCRALHPFRCLTLVFCHPEPFFFWPDYKSRSSLMNWDKLVSFELRHWVGWKCHIVSNIQRRTQIIQNHFILYYQFRLTWIPIIPPTFHFHFNPWTFRFGKTQNIFSTTLNWGKIANPKSWTHFLWYAAIGIRHGN